MALVGEAHIVVRAITDSINKDIQKGFSGASSQGSKAGDSMGQAFTKGFNKNVNQNTFSRISDGLSALSPGAEKARSAFLKLTATSFALQSGIGILIGGIGSLAGGIGALAGSAGGAIGGLAALGNTVVALGGAMAVAKLALGGVGAAIKALTKPASGGSSGGDSAGAAAAAKARAAADQAVQDAEKSLARTIQDNREALVAANNDVRDAQIALNKAFADGREEIQQLGFDAEGAALDEKKASLALGDARLALAKAQDLPPNSRVRQEAELAYQEADLNYRKAKDASDDLNAQQDALAKTGVKGTNAVISATNALAQAEANKSKTVEQAAQSEADAQDNLAKAKDNAATAGDSSGSSSGGGTDPFAGLNQAQIDFAKFIASLKPKFDELKEIAANSFLPPLTEAIKTLMGAPFDVVAKGVGTLGTALGGVVVHLADVIADATNLDNLGKIFTSSGPLLTSMGNALGSLYGAALSILVASAPVAQKFFDFLADRLDTFDKYLKSVKGNTALTTFFKEASDNLAIFGDIFGNIFKGFGQIIQANLGPGTGGGLLLTYLDDATSKFAALDGSARGKNTLSQYFLDAAGNLKSILGFFGELLKALGSLGADTNLAKTFDILKGAIDPLKDIVKQGIDAGPAFAGLVVALAKFVDKLSDLGAIKVFFDTATTVVKIFTDILNNPLVNAIATVHGRFVAFTAVFSILGTIGAFAFKVIVGGIQHLVGPIGTVIKAFGAFGGIIAAFKAEGFAGGMAKIGGAFKGPASEKDKFIANLKILDAQEAESAVAAGGFGGVLEKLKGGFSSALGGLKTFGAGLGSFLTSPAGIVIGIIALIVGAFILLYKTSDTFRAQMQPVIEQLSATFSAAGTQIMAAITPLIPLLGQALQSILAALTPIIPILAAAFTSLITALLPLIPVLLNALIPIFTQLVTAIIPVVTTLVTLLVPVITTVINAILPLVVLLVQQLVPVFAKIITAIAPLVTMIINALVPVITTLLTAVGPLISTLLTALVPVFKVLMDAITPLIPIIVQLVTGALGLIAPILTVLSPLFKLAGDVIQVVITIIAALIQTIVDLLTGNFSDIGKVWSDAWNSIYDTVSGVMAQILGVLQDVWNNIIAFFTDAFNAYVNLWVTIFTTIYNFISTIFGNIVKFFQTVIGNIVGFFVNGFNGLVGFVSGVFNGIASTVEDVFNGIKSTVKGIVNGIIGMVEGMVNGVIGAINGLSGGIRNAISAVAGALGIKVSIGSIPKISLPRLAKGGIVYPSAGGSIVNVAEAGKPERIEPLDEDGLSKRDKALIDYMGGGSVAGSTINVYATPGMDVNELAAEVDRRISFKMRKGAMT